MKIASLLYHNEIECPICGLILLSTSQIEWDHFQPLALGGEHDDTNIRAVHKSCHRLKTSGTKATSYGSDIHAIAKIKRLAAGPKKSKHKWPKRKLRGGSFCGQMMRSK